MKTLFYFALLFLFFSFSSDQPVTWLAETEYDFGDVTFQEPVHHSFQFKNTSGEPLVIDNIRPGCGCTAVDWEDKVIEPDSIGTINATYDAHIKGYFRKIMKVYFSGYNKAEKLWLQGYVIE